MDITDAFALITDAHPHSTVAIKVGMWRHVHGDMSSRNRLVLDVAIFKPGSSQVFETANFEDAASLLAWAKAGAKIAEVANA